MQRQGLAWDWADAGRCALCAVPAALVIATADIEKGLAWSVGVLPAAIIGMPPLRRDRPKLILIGALFAVSVIIGSILSRTALLAVVGIFLVAYGSAILASRVKFGQVALVLCAPIAAIGLSYPDMGKALGLGVIMLAGTVWSCVVFMLWHDRPAAPESAPQLLPTHVAHTYGILLGLAAASSAAIAEAAHSDHVGWAVAAALFVMRPKREMQELRSIGRVVAVFIGALAAVVFVRLGPSGPVVAVAAVAALAGAGGIRKSRWYAAPAFTTFLALTLLLYPEATTAQEQWRFKERVGETILGVAMAYLFGLAVPQALEWFRRRRALSH